MFYSTTSSVLCCHSFFAFLVCPNVHSRLRRFGLSIVRRCPASGQVRIAASVPTVRICSSSGRETGGVGSTGTVGSSVPVGKACVLGQIARLVLHGFMLRSGLGAPAVQLLTAALLFCPVRGDSCLSEWGILRPFSTPAPEKVCCGSSSSESSWRERQTGRSAGSRTFELQALGSIRFLPIRLWGNVCFSSFSGPSIGMRDLTGRDSSLDPQLGKLWASQSRPLGSCWACAHWTPGLEDSSSRGRRCTNFEFDGVGAPAWLGGFLCSAGGVLREWGGPNAFLGVGRPLVLLMPGVRTLLTWRTR